MPSIMPKKINYKLGIWLLRRMSIELVIHWIDINILLIWSLDLFLEGLNLVNFASLKIDLGVFY